MTVNPIDLRLFSGLLAAPTQDSLAVLQELAQEHQWLQEPVEELAGLALDNWQGEHTRLFISGYPKTVCPPFESAYRYGDMGGSGAGELMALYRRVGLEPADIPPDYLGAMLECAAYLLEQPSARDEEAWAVLWDGHLAAWLPGFARDLMSESRLRLYRRLGEQLLSLFPDEP